MKITEEMVDNACLTWLSVELTEAPLGDVMRAVLEMTLKNVHECYTGDEIYHAWHKSGIDVLGGNWNEFSSNLEFAAHSVDV